MTIDRATRISLRGAMVAILATLVLAAAVPAAPASAASPTACKVRNVTRGTNHKSLATAVKRAKQRNKLTVRGKCIGKAKIINKKLTIVGVRNKRSGPPILRGNGRGPVLYICCDRAKVTLKKLIIEGKPNQAVAYDGAGILLGGRLTLKNVRIRNFETTGDGGGMNVIDDGSVRLMGTTAIRHNRANQGGGIHNAGARVVLEGRSSVDHNRASWGGGIHTGGLFSLLKMAGHSSVHDNAAIFDGGGVSSGTGDTVLKDFASVSDNEAGRDGGGLATSGGAKLTLEGSSAVAGNTADKHGGGVYAEGDTLTMRDSSTVTGNTAGLFGGGVKSQSWVTLDGVVCAPDASANVSGNSPDDCHDG